MKDFTFFSKPPRPSLAPFVECYWGVRGVLDYRVGSVVPTGTVELMVNFGARQRVVACGEREAADIFDVAWISGMQDQRLVHAAEGGRTTSRSASAPGAPTPSWTSPWTSSPTG